MNDHGDAVLCDFGLSRNRHEVSRTFTHAQTSENYRFLAPELLTFLMFPEEHGGPVRPTQESDVYSMAMTFLELGTFDRPFSEIPSSERVAEAVLSGRRPRKPDALCGMDEEVLTEFWDLLERMWFQEPSDRCMLDQVLIHFD